MLRELRPWRLLVLSSKPDLHLDLPATPAVRMGAAAKNPGSAVPRGRWEQKTVRDYRWAYHDVRMKIHVPSSSGLRRVGLLFAVISAFPIPAPFP